ncbi:F-box only protein 24 [Bombina bombina]|uniref:F-box only protein 24 n=1 Tax=Bombina bombina TaxID=8345 RepID=UPI00235A90D2|nr:F-box only protein 24 [Bombina bombina]
MMPQTVRCLHNLARENRRASSSDLAPGLSMEIGVSVIAQTVRRTLLNVNLYGWRLRKNPLLALLHKTEKKRKILPMPVELSSCSNTVNFLDLPREMIDHVISYLSVHDVALLGETCRFMQQFCNSPLVWKRIFHRISPYSRVKDKNWKRAAILNYTKGMHFQSFRGRKQAVQHIDPPTIANGIKRFLPTKEYGFILDDEDILFLQVNPLAFSHYISVCRNVKDFSIGPGIDGDDQKCLYVITSFNCLKIYSMPTCQKVFEMMFGPLIKFKQLVVLGPPSRRILLFVTEAGKVYSLVPDEIEMRQRQPYSGQIIFQQVSQCLLNKAVTQIYTNQDRVIYVTDQGIFYCEVQSSAMDTNLFANFHSLEQITPLPLIHSKIVKCSIGYNHLAMVDDFGRILLQGNNKYGQLGLGDRFYREKPTQVPGLRCPVDICCGLHHTLILMQKTDKKELYGCGVGCRLPGSRKGSSTFIKLNVKVPACTRFIYSTREHLYMISTFDTDEISPYRPIIKKISIS